MNIKNIFTLTTLLMLAPMVLAQYTVDNKKAVSEFEKGQSLLSGNPSKAFEHFEKALKAAPSFAEVHLTMAAWLLDHDSLDLARPSFAQTKANTNAGEPVPSTTCSASLSAAQL